MNVWGPVALIVFLSFAAAAIGVHVAVVSCVSLAASCVAIILSIGGLGRSDESTAMTIGFGLMFMIPTAVVTGLAVTLGHALRGKRVGVQEAGSKRIDQPTTPSRAVDMALMQLRIHRSISVRCPTCGCRLAARQVESANRDVPAISVSCLCGACTGVHPLRRSD